MRYPPGQLAQTMDSKYYVGQTGTNPAVFSHTETWTVGGSKTDTRTGRFQTKDDIPETAVNM